MNWKLTIYGFNPKTAMPFDAVIFMDEDRQDEILISYMEISNCILHSAELERVDES